MVAWFTHLQRRTPDGLRGRAMAAAEMLLTLPYVGAIAAGAALVEVVDFRVLSAGGAVRSPSAPCGSSTAGRG